MDQLNLNPALDFLHDLGTRIAAADPLHEVLDEIVEFVADLVSCDSCFIFVLEGDELVLRASKNPHPEALDRLKMQIGQGIPDGSPSIASPWSFLKKLHGIRGSKSSANFLKTHTKPCSRYPLCRVAAS